MKEYENKENEGNELRKELEKLKEENKQLKQLKLRNELNNKVHKEKDLNSVGTKMVLNLPIFNSGNIIHKAENKLIGLKNIGQPSYINPVLQCLIQTESLKN